MLDLGDHEQEEAWGERVTVDGQECRGVFAPLEGWYEVELGGRVCKVQTSLRVRRKALKSVPAAGRSEADGPSALRGCVTGPETWPWCWSCPKHSRKGGKWRKSGIKWIFPAC